MKTLNSTNLKLFGKQSRLLFAALCLSASAAQAQVLISENFSTGNVQVPPAGWSNVDLGGTDDQGNPVSNQIWNFNNPGGLVLSGGTPGFSGQFASLNSDYQSGIAFGYTQNAALESPAFDATSTAVQYRVEFDDNFENYYNQIGTVEVWNGTVWTTVFTELETPPSGNGGDGSPDPSVHRVINITAATGHNAAAKVRFHFISGDGLWWAVDNVSVIAFACTSPSATTSVVTNCANNQYSVNVNVTNLGSATSLSLTNGVLTYGSPITAAGTYAAGPFASGSSQNIVLVHNPDTLCNVNFAPIVSYCPPSNDECSTPTVLTPGVTCTPIAGYTASATASTAGGSSCQQLNQGDVWYSFVATQTNHVITTNSVASVQGNPYFKWGIQYFSGSCGSLVSQGCAMGVQNIGTTPAELLASGLTIGQTYYVKVWADSAYDAGFAAATNSITFNICVTSVPAPSCATLTAPLNATTTGVFPQLEWDPANYATSYNVYLDQNASPTTLVANVTTTSYTPTTALTAGATYHWYVQPIGSGGNATGCNTAALSFTTAAPPANDGATGAVALTVDGTCSGAIYTNVNANHNPNEPFPNCNLLNNGEHSVWFSFVAPASGAVKISTDGSNGTLTDTKIGLFSATSVTDYSTFTQLACDDDNGVNGDGYYSTIYATDLSPSQTYYVQVDGSDATSTGTFCLVVSEVNSGMLSSSASCASVQTPSVVGANAGYSGWVSIVDANGNLVASVRNSNGGSPADYTGSLNIDAGVSLRQDAAGTYYLSRNYRISNATVSTPVDVRVYFTAAEMAALNGTTSGAVSLSNLNLTKQEGTTCIANYTEGSGVTSALLQTANGSVNGVNWIQFTTSSFSNFYLMGGTNPLAIVIKSIAANNRGTVNVIDWATASEAAGDRMELERSADGKNYTSIAKIASKGTASDYSYTDQNPLNGVNYYRLKLVNAEGQSVYSKVVTATAIGAKGFDLQAYPNPAATNVKVKAYGSSNGVVSLTDISGRVVYHAAINGSEATIDLSRLSNGVYFLKYADDVQSKTIKLSKQ